MISGIIATMKPEIADLEVFVDIGKTLSFTATATRLRLERTVVSKRIQRLENALGVQLLKRTTRNVGMTDEGKLLLKKATEICEGLHVLSDLFSKPIAPQGLVKLSAPATVSQSHLTKVFPIIRKKYPGIQIELVSTDRILDFVGEGLDLTIRAAVPSDSSFIGRILVRNQLLLAASPKYLKQFGTPTKVSQLQDHALLFLDFHRDISFLKASVKLREFENRRSYTCNDARILKRLAEEGEGICFRPSWDFDSEFTTGSLVEISLRDTLFDTTCLYLLYPNTGLLPNRTKVVIEELVRYFEKFR